MYRLAPLVLAIFGTLILAGCIPQPRTSAELATSYAISHPLAQRKAYDTAEVWIGEHFASAKAVIEVRQPDAGVLLGNVSFTTSNLPGSTIYVKALMKITLKDKSASIQFAPDESLNYTDGQVEELRARTYNLASGLAGALEGTLQSGSAQPRPATKAAIE